METQNQYKIVIDNPSPKLLELIRKMRERKMIRRKEMRNVKPMYTIEG